MLLPLAQIMVLLTSALRVERPAELRLQALEGWLALMRALSHAYMLHSQFVSVMDQVRWLEPNQCFAKRSESRSGSYKF